MKTKFVMAATVLAVGVAVVLVALVAPGSGGERSVVAQTPPEDREYGYLDQVHNTYILAQWNPLYPSFGGLLLSIEGLGAVYLESGLQVTDGPNGTLEVSYSGAANLDAGATYDGIFGYTFVPSGSTQAATLTLSGTISTDRVESDFEITVNSTPYTLQTTPFVHDAEAAAAEILDLFRDEQWVDVYDAFYSPFQAAVSEQDFVQQAATSSTSNGTIERFTIEPAFDYTGQPGAGHRAAAGEVTILSKLGSAYTRGESVITLIRDGGEWKLVSLDPPTTTTSLTTVSVDGTATQATTTAGKAEFVFEPQTGQLYSVLVTTSGFSAGTASLVSDGGSSNGPISSSKAFFDTFVAGEGPYELTASSSAGQDGQVSVQVFPITHATGAIVPGGAAVPVTVSTPGQNAELTWTAAIGQQVGVAVTASTISSGTVRLVRPDGTTQAQANLTTSGATIPTQSILTNGEYRVVVDPAGDRVGSATVALQESVGDVVTSIEPGGPPVSVSITQPQGRARLLFSGSPDQRVSVNLTNSSLSSSQVSVRRPDDSALTTASFGTSGTFVDVVTLPESGQYSILIDPNSTNIGSVTVQLYDVPADFSSSITAGGSSVTATTSAPGQNAQLTFSGTSGQRVSVELTGVTMNTAWLKLLKPDGSTLGQSLVTSSTGFLDVQTLPTTGTYVVLLDPSGTKTGSATVQLYDVPADFSSSITAGGSSVTATTSAPGQNAQLTFSGTSGQRVSVELTGVTMNTAWLKLLKPDGSTLGQSLVTSSTGFLDVQPLPTTGTYVVLLDPSGTKTGSATVQLYDVPADFSSSITAGGSSVTATTSAPGQNAQLTFSGTSGQRVSVELTGVTMNTAWLKLLKPDGSTLGQSLVTSSTGFLDVQTLPTTGTYVVLLDPSGTKTGSATVQLYDVPADFSSSITAGGSSVTATTTVPGQNAQLTFSGTAGQVVTINTSGNTMQTFTLKLLKPDGTTVASTSVFGTTGSLANKTLPVTGTYTIVLDPSGTKVGSSTVQLVTVP